MKKKEIFHSQQNSQHHSEHRVTSPPLLRHQHQRREPLLNHNINQLLAKELLSTSSLLIYKNQGDRLPFPQFLIFFFQTFFILFRLAYDRYVEYAEFERFPDNEEVTSKKSAIEKLENKLKTDHNNNKHSELKNYKTYSNF